jgi:uncharacterized protein (DUF1501 family)
MQRRNFIKSAGVAAAAPMFLNGLQMSTLQQSSIFNFINPESDRVLILVQLNGGNDGLNMVIPRDQYDGLAAVRGNIMVPEGEVIRLTDKVGLHPSMKNLEVMYNEGRAGFIQSVGYPNHNRSHFRSIDIWTSGSSSRENINTGWMGRYLDTLYPDYPEPYPTAEHPHPFAITMGSIVSETCQGIVANYSMTLEDPFNIYPLFEEDENALTNTPYGDELKFLRLAIEQTNDYSDEITAAAMRGRNRVEYNMQNRLARQLKNVALLMSGGLQTKVYILSIGGFDTHANQVQQGQTVIGSHATLLEKISNAIATFQNDLKAQGMEHRAIGMTFSEFGRKIKSNKSFGTDHGSAAPMILFGSCINPTVLGENPEIHPDVSPGEGLPMQYDFRDVYSSILVDWFEVEEAQVRTLMYPEFQKLPIIQVCEVISSEDKPIVNEAIEVNNFPNPFQTVTTIAFRMERESRVRLSIFDALGRELQVLFDKKLPGGAHQMPFDGSRLAAGNYFYRLQLGGQVRTRRMVKI